MKTKTRHVKFSHVHTPAQYKGYDCSQCGRALGKMCWEGDSGVYCRQRCADAHVEGLDEMKREDARVCKRCGETGNVEHDADSDICNPCVDAIQGGASSYNLSEDEMTKKKQNDHGGAREGAGPKTLASKGLATKSARVTVRFTAIELAVLQRDADADECSVAELIAQRALAYTITLHDHDDE